MFLDLKKKIYLIIYLYFSNDGNVTHHQQKYLTAASGLLYLRRKICQQKQTNKQTLKVQSEWNVPASTC